VKKLKFHKSLKIFDEQTCIELLEKLKPLNNCSVLVEFPRVGVKLIDLKSVDYIYLKIG
jgi:hypothetical protein